MNDQRARTQPTRVLIVDDDAGIRLLLESLLAAPSFETVSVETAAGALSAAHLTEFDAVLLDRFLPETDALGIVPAMRAALPSAAIIMLSAVDDVEARILGLQAGADDFLTKPFHVSEVIARVEAVRRRGLVTPDDPDVLRYADLELHMTAYRVSRGGEPISVTPTELRLLQLLAENAERVLSRGHILEAVWGYDFGGDEVVEKAISTLRKKVDAGRTPLIQTVRGFGYCLREEQR